MRKMTLLKHLRNTVGILSLLAFSACSAGGDSEEQAPSQQALSHVGVGDMKWNPGHYVKFSASATDEQINARLEEVEDLPFVKGIVIRSYWKELEPLKDAYDFQRIDRQLELVAAKGKRLFLLLTTKGFSRGAAVPDYLRVPFYDGGVFETMNLKGHPGENIALWNNDVRYRLVLLVKELARRYNDHPNFEGLIFNETAFGQPVEPVSDENKAAFYTNLIHVNTVAREAFSRTLVVQYINFPGPRTGPIVENMLSKGVGFGAPDTFLADEDHEKYVYPYNEQVQGRIPIAMQVESDALLSPCFNCPFNPPPVEEIFALARDRLHSNYLFWDYFQSPSYRAWDKILEMFKKEDFPATSSGGLATKCPKSYATCLTDD